MRASCCSGGGGSHAMTRTRWPSCKLGPLLCCSFLLGLVLVAAEIEYYPDFESGGASSEAEVESQQAARLERLVRLLERRSHQQQQRRQDEDQDEEDQDEQEEEEEHARQAWSSRLLEQTLAMERERLQRELAEQRMLAAREQAAAGEVLERPELPEVMDLLQQAALRREREREWQRQRMLQEYQARLQRQQQQRLQELDYPELRGGVEPERPRPEFTYSFHPEQRPNSEQHRPFAVGPSDPRFYSNQAWNNNQQDKQEKEQDEYTTTTTTTTTTTAASHRVPLSLQEVPAGQEVMKVEQRRASNEAGLASELQVISLRQKLSQEDVYVIALVAGCSAALMFALVLMSLLWCRLQRVSKAAKDVDYPAYGVTGPNKDLSPSSAADQRLAQSAQMYHFQHQKQQIIAMEKASTGGAGREPGSVSEAESDEENDEGDYTVYECPGLAPTGEMEVKNPLFHDEPTPQTPAKSKHEYTTDEDDL